MGYVGKVVLVERRNPTKDYSSYYDGEYLVLDETPNQLFVLPYAPAFSVYDLGGFSMNGGKLPLHGTGAFDVIRVGEPNVSRLL